MTDAYHGTPITPKSLLDGLPVRRFNFCASFFRPDQIDLLVRICRRLMIDNGAFSAWMANRKRIMAGFEPIVFDREYWRRYYEFLAVYLPQVHASWFVIPDVIDAGTQEQDALLREVPAELVAFGWPVWHLDEPISRALRLIDQYGRICFGSTAEYAVVGSPEWRSRMDDLFNAIAITFRTIPENHMLRGMQCQLPSYDYPFTRVDSTDIARNHNRLNDRPEHKTWLLQKKLERWDDLNCPTTWPPRRLTHKQFELPINIPRPPQIRA